ncbi:hypothetical protein [Kitasatospora sp. NPDC088783]|uniref:hypothetical protein n=1 Tax=Kitasatospora sp. NPDC088783 TaxID=3364077 RepID=UPI00380F88E4
MTATAGSTRQRLIPTGACFCGCDGDAEIGRFFVRGHDSTAAAALRALDGASLAQRLVAAGFGPHNSVVAAAVERAGWQPCAHCAYAGTESGLAAHRRGGTCPGRPPGGGQPARRADRQPAAEAAPPAEEGAPAPGQAGPPQAKAPAPAEQDRAQRAETGAAAGLDLPPLADPLWKGIPLPLRQEAAAGARRLLTRPSAVLAEKKHRRVLLALRAVSTKRADPGHWRTLVTTARETLGSPRSAAADRMYKMLQQITAEYLEPALRPAAAGADAR